MISKNTIKDVEWVMNQWAGDHKVSNKAIRSLFRRLAKQAYGNKSFTDSIKALKEVFESPDYDEEPADA